VQVEHDHFRVNLGSCAAVGCELVFDMEIDASGWPIAGTPVWLDDSGVWARATNLLPRLGLDPERVLRASAMRRSLGLAVTARTHDAMSLAPAEGVAPAGRWHWRVMVDGAGAQSSTAGTTDGALDFAVAWSPRQDLIDTRPGLAIWRGPSHRAVAGETADDLALAQECVRERLGASPPVMTLLQAPRGLGDVALHGDLLWLPEETGWDVAADGVGRSQRRARLAEVLAARLLADRADLRAESGASWLLDGVAGWIGLECVRSVEGDGAWVALLARRSDRAAEAFGALDAPIVSLADDGRANWVKAYAPLATLGWTQSIGEDEALRAAWSVVERARTGQSVPRALAQAVGSEVATRLLGTPSAAEVSVALRDGDAPEVRGERFAWDRGGWKTVATDIEIAQRYRDQAAPSRLARVPTKLERDKQFTVLDAWPSFERSPLDNLWHRSQP
jgi:hypothetical protein